MITRAQLYGIFACLNIAACIIMLFLITASKTIQQPIMCIIVITAVLCIITAEENFGRFLWAFTLAIWTVNLIHAFQ